MSQLTIFHNPLLRDTWEEIETDDVCASLAQRFEHFPSAARLYHGGVSVEQDVTPATEEDVEKLRELPGPFFVVVYPQDPFTIGAIIFAAVTVVTLLQRPQIPTASLRNQDLSSPNNSLSERTNRPRINGRIPDIFGTVRSVPDLVALPYTVFENHIEVEYSFMVIGRGAYSFPNVDGVPSIRDGQTLVSKIEGSTVEVFGPGTSPNSADLPQLRIGDPITVPVISPTRSKAVNGQVLLAPNDAGDARIVGASNIRFGPTSHIQANPASTIDFTTVFAPAGVLTLTAPDIYFEPGSTGTSLDSYTWNYNQAAIGGTIRFYSDGRIEFRDGAALVFAALSPISLAFTIVTGTITKDAISVNLTGHYRYTGHTNLSSDPPIEELTVANPELSNADWTSIASMTGGYVDVTAGVVMTQGGTAYLSGEYTVDAVTDKTITLVDRYAVTDYWAWINPATPYLSPTLEGIGASSTNWVGPFVMDRTDTNEFISNFIGAQGLWKDDGVTQTAFDIDVQVGVAPCSASGVLTGPESFYNGVVLGSANVKSQRALTIRQTLPFTGRFSVRARRLTPKDTTFAGSIADEIKWRDMYAVAPVAQDDFGDVTTVHSVTQATAGALSVSERQLNMLVTRNLPQRVSGSTFTTTLFPTNDAADIISFMALSPTLGRRTVQEVDFNNIYDTLSAVQLYFGTALAREFSYTFDKDNVTFEEMVQTVAAVVFCTAYRQGSVLRLFFESDQTDSFLLFNHRNKVPNTETRTVTFGSDFDGIEYEWVNPADDSVDTFYVPTNQSATKPRRVQSVGVRTLSQAHLHAYREYNKLRYRHTAVEFEATEEANLLVPGQRVLVADNLRPEVHDGYVVEQTGLQLRLSQPVPLELGLVIFLQHIDATVESIPITVDGSDSYVVTLGSAPALALVVDDDAAARTRYIIAPSVNAANRRAFLVSSRDPNGNFTSKLTLFNYDSRFYQNDRDFA